jgi:hypothetical protein
MNFSIQPRRPPQQIGQPRHRRLRSIQLRHAGHRLDPQAVSLLQRNRRLLIRDHQLRLVHDRLQHPLLVERRPNLLAHFHQRLEDLNLSLRLQQRRVVQRLCCRSRHLGQHEQIVFVERLIAFVPNDLQHAHQALFIEQRCGYQRSSRILFHPCVARHQHRIAGLQQNRFACFAHAARGPGVFPQPFSHRRAWIFTGLLHQQQIFSIHHPQIHCRRPHQIAHLLADHRQQALHFERCVEDFLDIVELGQPHH